MTMSDPIADMLTRIRNANTAKHEMCIRDSLEGKTKRRGMTFGKTAKTKKAIVKLTEDSKEIEIFQGL